jgi:uncharacterized protein YjlB
MCSAKQVKRLNGRREDHFFRRDWVPNNQRLPVVIHKFLQARPLRTISRTCSPQTDGQTFGGMAFSTTSIIIPGAHEVLGVGQGSGTVLIGAPDGWVIKVATVDCLILPAGTGHMNLGCSPDFEGGIPGRSACRHADLGTFKRHARRNFRVGRSGY